MYLYLSINTHTYRNTHTHTHTHTHTNTHGRTLMTVPSKDKCCRDLLFSFMNSTHKARDFVTRRKVL